MGFKTINKAKMNIKTASALIVTAIVVSATCVSLFMNNRSGMTSDRDEIEFLHSTIEDGFVGGNDDVSEQVNSYYKNLNTNSVYDTVELPWGKTIYFAQGSTVIVTEGRLVALCDDNNLIDITEGNVLAEGEAAKHNHLYVIQNDERGLYARGDAKILIKGGYEINNGNEE